jgi:hypothetical protein
MSGSEQVTCHQVRAVTLTERPHSGDAVAQVVLGVGDAARHVVPGVLLE